MKGLPRNDSFGDKIYQNMKWLDAKNWEDEMPYASNHMEELPSLFKNPINKANFDCCVVDK